MHQCDIGLEILRKGVFQRARDPLPRVLVNEVLELGGEQGIGGFDGDAEGEPIVVGASYGDVCYAVLGEPCCDGGYGSLGGRSVRFDLI